MLFSWRAKDSSIRNCWLAKRHQTKEVVTRDSVSVKQEAADSFRTSAGRTVCVTSNVSTLSLSNLLLYVLYSPNSIWLVMSRLDTKHRRVEPMHFGCVELVEQHGSTRSSRRARHVERVVSRRDESRGIWAYRSMSSLSSKQWLIALKCSVLAGFAKFW